MTSLKLSRSMNSAATGVWLRRERAIICSTRSWIKVRFGRPVKASWVARNESSSSRRVSSSSVRWRSVSKHSHIRSRLNSRLSCRMLRAWASTSGGVSSCAALSCSTSAITLRHQKQRQVTSSSDAARCTASSPKISQVSRPASIATSMPSPEIQRATATVELLLIRSKLSWTTVSRSWAGPAVRSTVSLSTSSVRSFSASPRRRRSSPNCSTWADGGAGTCIASFSKFERLAVISNRVIGGQR